MSNNSKTESFTCFLLGYLFFTNRSSSISEGEKTPKHNPEIYSYPMKKYIALIVIALSSTAQIFAASCPGGSCNVGSCNGGTCIGGTCDGGDCDDKLGAVAPGTWTTNYKDALATAKANNDRVFMVFEGSDWCGYCMKLEKEALQTAQFIKFAKDSYVLTKIDFPKKTQQSPALKDQNAKLKAQYKVSGFPTIVVLNSQGREIKRFSGYSGGGATALINMLKSIK